MTDKVMILEDYIGNTPLVTLQHIGADIPSNKILVKLEGNNPAGSVKDRLAVNIVEAAERNGTLTNQSVI